MVRYLLTSCVVEFIRRIMPMFQATWVQLDVLLDARQTLIYYNYADPNGSYADWAQDYMRKSNSSYKHTVSEGYYVTAIVVWILTPMLLALFHMISKEKERRPLSFFSAIFDNKYEIESINNCCFKALLVVLLFPVDVICALFFIYVMIPLASFKMAFKVLMRHEFGGLKNLIGIKSFQLHSTVLPFWKGFEFLGEALPQLVLAVVFVVNNYDFAIESETLIGLKEFEVTLISIFFSFGSLVMGLYSAISSYNSHKFILKFVLNNYE